MEKIVYVFNQLYYNFVQDTHATVVDEHIKEKLQSILESRDKRSPTSHLYIERINEQLSTSTALADVTSATYDAVLGVDSVAKLRVVKKLTVEDLKKALKDECHNTLCSYVCIFIMLSYLYKLVLDGHKHDDNSDDEEGATEDDAIKVVDAALSCFREIQVGKEVDPSETVTDANVVSLLRHIAKVITPTKEDAPDGDDIASKASDMLKNTKIGSLAKEISEEIDINSLNINKPEDLLNPGNLMGGNSVLTDIIGKVGTKIHQKINNGEIKHEELMSEAINMLGMLGKSGDGAAGSFLNNPLFKDVMKNMGNFQGMANMAKNSDKTKSANVRDRLRKKLDEKNKTIL